ncbi:MAG: amidohydrolase family protein [Coriobacteriia bacterium]|nr:amidohydrolase family protein [Coriobacteriia bacterium]
MSVSRRQFLAGATALAASLAAAGSLSACSSDAKAQQAYVNGKIYTCNDENPWVEAIAVADGKFIGVGTTEEIKKMTDGKTEVVDLEGKTVIPGLIEGHTHFSFMAAMNSLGYVEIPNGIDTVKGCLAQLEKFVKDHPDYDQYVIGNFNQTLDMGAKDLDKICADKPVACVGMGLHCLYVNSKFMEVGKITKDTKDAIPGETYYVRDKDGKPTGKIVELPQSWTAFQQTIKLDNEKVKKEYVKLQKLYHSYGFIGIADGGFLGLDEENMLKVITELESEGRLSMLVNTSSIWYGHTVTPIEEITERVTGNKEKYTTDLCRPGTVKMWSDGTIGAYSALMREPYSDKKDTSGVQLSTVDDLTACANMCKENDLNAHFHAIGDKAIDHVLDAFEAVGETPGTKSIVHFQLDSADIIKRAAKIDGLIVNMTPSWGNALIPEEIKPLGDRTSYNGMYKEAMNAGITVNFGADSNGDPAAWNPSLIMTIAMIRNPKEDGIFLKGEPCTFEEVVKAYSLNVAKERRIEDEYGSIEVGKLANFVVWDKEAMDDAVALGELGVALEAGTKASFAEQVFFKGEPVMTLK